MKLITNGKFAVYVAIMLIVSVSVAYIGHRVSGESEVIPIPIHEFFEVEEFLEKKEYSIVDMEENMLAIQPQIVKYKDNFKGTIGIFAGGKNGSSGANIIFHPNGDFTTNGRKITNDKELYKIVKFVFCELASHRADREFKTCLEELDVDFN